MQDVNINLLSSVRLRALVMDLVAQGSEMQIEVARQRTVIGALLLERQPTEITFNPEEVNTRLMKERWGLYMKAAPSILHREPNITYYLEQQKEISDGPEGSADPVRGEDPEGRGAAEVDGNPPSDGGAAGDSVPPGS